MRNKLYLSRVLTSEISHAKGSDQVTENNEKWCTWASGITKMKSQVAGYRTYDHSDYNLTLGICDAHAIAFKTKENYHGMRGRNDQDGDKQRGGWQTPNSRALNNRIALTKRGRGDRAE